MHFYTALFYCQKRGHIIRRKCWPKNTHIIYGKHLGDMGEQELFAVEGTKIKAGNCIRYHFDQNDILSDDWESKPNGGKK